MKRFSVRIAAVLVCGLLGSAVAGLPEDGILQPGLYRIHNHPNGAVRPPLYGLRLDELFNLSTMHDVWTFDFDHAGSEMFIDYSLDGMGVGAFHIYGTSYGGLDIGPIHHPFFNSFFDIDFTYEGVTLVPGDDDLWVTGPDFSNHGTIRPVNDLQGVFQRNLYDFSGDFGYTFRLGDVNDDEGLRGYDGISGWGWMNYRAGPPIIHAVDWLFTVDPKPVPAPGAVALGVLGLFLVRTAGRRFGGAKAGLAPS